MALQGNAISNPIRTTYGSFRSEDLMDYVVGLFTATAPGIAILDRLNARINKQIRQLYTPSEAVWLVLELEMPEKGMFFAMSLFCVIDALC